MMPALMAGPMPDKTPITPAIIDGGGLGAWFGWLVVFTLGGLLLTALFYNLIAYAMRRSLATATTAALPPFGPARFLRRTLHTWLRLVALLALAVVLMLVITIPVALLAGFVALLSQAIAVVVLFGALLEAAEGHVSDHQRVLAATRDACGMVGDVGQRHRQRRVVALQDHAQRVADQRHIIKVNGDACVSRRCNQWRANATNGNIGTGKVAVSD